MPIVEELKAVFSADTSGLDTGVTEASRKLDEFGDRADKASKATDRLGEMSKLAREALSGLGITLGVAEFVRFGADALKSANDLEKTEATVEALSGSHERYLEVLERARQGQQLYGGTLQENLAGLGSLVNLSNRSTVSLGELDEAARRLALVDPAQGIEGATIALKEFLTGTDATAIHSLTARFELPKTALEGLTDASVSAEERMRGLNKAMDDAGITHEVLTKQTETTAHTYDTLGAAFERLKTSAGQTVAEGFEPFARGLERILRLANDDRDAAAELQASWEKLGAGEAIDQGTLALKRRQIAAKEVAEATQAALEQSSFKLVNENGLFGGNTRFDQVKLDLQGLQERLISVSASSNENADRVRAFLEEFGKTQDVERLRNQLAGLEQHANAAYIAAAEGARRASDSAREHSQATKITSDELEKLGDKLTRTGETGATAYERLQDAEAKYTEEGTRRREDYTRKIVDIQSDGAQKLAELERDSAERRADIEATLQERVQDLFRDGNDKINTLLADAARQRETTAQASAKRLADIEGQIGAAAEDARRSAADRERDNADRLADLQQRSDDGRADRAQALANRLQDLQSRLGSATTDAERARIQEQIATAQRDAEQREAQAARDEQRQRDRLQRDLDRANQAAAEALARKQAALQAEAEAERAAQAQREATQAAETERQRQAIIAEYTKRTTDAQAQHDKEIAQLADKVARERQQLEQATAQRLAEAQSAYQRDEQQRAAAFARQEQQLKESLGKQLQEYTRIQQQMSQISDQEAARRLLNIQREYGVSPDRGAGDFGALASISGGTGVTPGQQRAAADAFGALNGLGIRLPGAAGAIQSALTVQAPINVYGVTDPQAVALLVRDELLRIARDNGSTGIT